MSRKIIHLFDADTTWTALCDDGTTWTLIDDAWKPWPPPIPQDETADDGPTCERCDGRGLIEPDVPVTCPDCIGTGAAHYYCEETKSLRRVSRAPSPTASACPLCRDDFDPREVIRAVLDLRAEQLGDEVVAKIREALDQ